MADEYATYAGSLMPANPNRNALLDLMAEDSVGRDPKSLWQRFGVLPSSQMQQRGPWMRDYLPPQAADFAERALPAVGAIASRGGAGMAYEAGLPQRMQARPTGPGGSHEWNPNGPIDPGILSMTPEPWSPGMRSTADLLRNMRVGGERVEPANSNTGPAPAAPTRAYDPKFARGLRESEGLDPLNKVDLPADADMVARYLAALQGQGRPQPPNLTVIEGGQLPQGPYSPK